MDIIIRNYLLSFSSVLLFITIAAMLFILSRGADVLVDEACSLSIHWGIPKIIVGATIVSLGTTLPEVTVSVLAAIKGNPDLALGNAIGSIIADTGLIIGISALIGHLPVEKIIINRQGKIQFLSGILLAIVCLPVFSHNNVGSIKQWMGWIFLLLLAIYIYMSVKWAKNSDAGEENSIAKEKSPITLQLIKIFLGMFFVIGSSKILIPAVEITAIRIGIPQSVIAATLVAFGTSLPELVTAITAVRKGHGELAVGNIIGADILNVLFVLGSAAAVTKGGLLVPSNFYKLQIPTMLIILSAFRIFSKNKDNAITKKEGIFLFLIYIIYIILNYSCI